VLTPWFRDSVRLLVGKPGIGGTRLFDAAAVVVPVV
jgi:hypothetical protein